MARQRGIHQISGKINNLCYYEQKYVCGGLIRRINEAMSERLKIDPAFANTRVANTIFGGCSMMAGVLLSFFGNRNTYLFKPHRHALVTRAIHEYLVARNSSDEYPVIMERFAGYLNLPDIVNSIVRNSIFDSFIELQKHTTGVVLDGDVTFTFNYDSLVSFCKKNKCIGVQLSITRCHYIYPAAYDITSGKYGVPENNAGGRGSNINWYLNEDTGDVEIGTSTGEVDDATTFIILYATPIIATRMGRPVFGQTGASCGLTTFLLG